MTITVTANLAKTRIPLLAQQALLQTTNLDPDGAMGELLAFRLGTTVVVDPGPSLPWQVSVEVTPFPEATFYEMFPTPEDRQAVLLGLFPDMWLVALRTFLFSQAVVET